MSLGRSVFPARRVLPELAGQLRRRTVRMIGSHRTDVKLRQHIADLHAHLQRLRDRDQ